MPTQHKPLNSHQKQFCRKTKTRNDFYESSRELKPKKLQCGGAEAEQTRTETEQTRTEAKQTHTEAEQNCTEAEQTRTEAEQNRTEAEQNHTEAEQSRVAGLSRVFSRQWLKPSRPGGLWHQADVISATSPSQNFMVFHFKCSYLNEIRVFLHRNWFQCHLVRSGNPKKSTPVKKYESYLEIW